MSYIRLISTVILAAFFGLVTYGQIVRGQVRIPGPGGIAPIAAVAFINSTCFGSTGGNTVTSSNLDMTGATFFYFVVSDLNNGSTTLSDSSSNTYTATHASAVGTTAQNQIRAYYAKNVTGSATQNWTLTGTATFPSGCVAGYKNLNTSAPLDGTQETAAAIGNGTVCQGGSVTPANNNSLVSASFSISSGATTTYSVDLSFTIRSQIAYSASNHFGAAVADLIETTAAAKNPQWTWTTPAVSACSNAVFKQ